MRFSERFLQTCGILEKAEAGEALSMDEISLLYALPANSPEAYLLRCAGNKRAMELADGKAEIHAQIGVDAGPCVKSCAFCSFAECNNPEGELKRTPLRAILDYAKAFQDAGANLLLLMSSAEVLQAAGTAAADAAAKNTLKIRYVCIVLAAVPIFCITPFVQKYLVSGTMLGAVKG